MSQNDSIKPKIKLNPDAERVKEVRDGLKQTGGFCPCVPKYLWNEDTKCPCKEFRTKGDCHCELYIKVEN